MMVNAIASGGQAQGKSAVIHPPFSDNIRKIYQPLAGSPGVGADNITVPVTPIQRGFIRQDKTFPGYAKGSAGQHVFNFLYNPSTVSAQYTVQQSGAALAFLFSDPNLAVTPPAPTNNAVSFTVLFDRTYELWQSYKHDGTAIYAGSPQMLQAGNDPRVVGCYADIMQLMYLTGIFQTGQDINSVYSGKDSSGTAVTNFFAGTGNAGAFQASTGFSTTSGFMEMVQCWTYFSPMNNVVAYYGYISAWDYTITHWTQYMVPMRCSITINIQLMPAPLNGNGLPYSLGSSALNGAQSKQLVLQQVAKLTNGIPGT